MGKRISRPGVRSGYDRWAPSYDETPNPLVALERRHTIRHLRPRSGERILDAGCGTGANLQVIRRAGSRAVGVDFSLEMLRATRRKMPGVRLLQADLQQTLPLRRQTFDAYLCSLVSEHLTRLKTLFQEAHAVLRGGGRLVFSAFHPEVARAGVEANFERDGVEYRLGAETHTVEDYLDQINDAGFSNLRWRAYAPDADFAEEVPAAAKYIGRPLLLLVDAVRN